MTETGSGTIAEHRSRPPRPARARMARAGTAAWKNAVEIPAPFRVVGLDGVRAIAVTLVILFHLTPGTTVGGYLGVDIFFVVSGFLITSLLLRERADSGGVRLRAFWVRRARRLLPALGILILVCCSAAALIGGDVLVGLGLQVLGAATFSSNWLLLASGSSYFGDTLPELFRNLWSLAVEEQFYLVWPPLLVLLLFRMPRSLRIVGVALLAVASALAMAVLWTPADSTRVYYGTDTHAFGLAIGGVLALLATSWPRHALEWPRAVRGALGLAGPLAVLALLGMALTMPGDAAFVFRGGLVVVAVLTAIVIASLRVPGTPLAAVLELGAFRWIGRRSYGLYLWHWPVFVLVGSALPGWPRDGASGWALGGIALSLTVVASALSYRFVEQPIRRHGFREAARRVASGWRATAPRAIATVAAALVVVSAGAGTIVALTSDPGVGQTQLAVEAGQRAIREAAVGSSTGSSPAAPSTPASPSATPSAAATGPQISAIGDSVMLAAAPELEARLPGISIDAAVSRRLPAALDVVAAEASAGTLRPVVIVGLATNGPIARSTLEQLRAEIGRERELVVITAQAPRGWIDPNNRILSAFAASYRNVEISDWHEAAQPILGDLNRDQIHFGPTGARVFTDAIQAALERLAELPPAGGPLPNAPKPTPY
jgi:peptidoglycan/LPS O-acetylase OafA/YrhL